MAKPQRGKVCAAMYCDNGSESGKTRLSWPKLKRERQHARIILNKIMDEYQEGPSQLRNSTNTVREQAPSSLASTYARPSKL
jgi:hypothetical protein